MCVCVGVSRGQVCLSVCLSVQVLGNFQMWVDEMNRKREEMGGSEWFDKEKEKLDL